MNQSEQKLRKINRNNINKKRLNKRKKNRLKRRLIYTIRIVILCVIVAIPIVIINLIINNNIIDANDKAKIDSFIKSKYNEEDLQENDDEQNYNKEDKQGIKKMLKNLLPEAKVKQLKDTNIPNWIDEQIIEVDGTSRPGVELDDIKDIVVHYVGNPRTTAQQNHDYYQNDDSGVSSHFVVGLEGEIIQCIPLNEKSQANNWRNNDTISIEVCHPDTTGKFTEETYDSLVKLTAWLMDVCDLDEEHVIRHYDITGKDCPVYFVKNEDKWTEFKQDVKHKRDSQ